MVSTDVTYWILTVNELLGGDGPLTVGLQPLSRHLQYILQTKGTSLSMVGPRRVTVM